MTPYVPSIVVDAVCGAIGAFLQPFVGADTPIVRAYDNRVASPKSPYVELTELLQLDLETPSATHDGTNQQTALTSPTHIDVQIDFVGPSAGDQCKAVKGIVRSPYAVAQFPVGIAPLYCDDGHNTTMVTGEQQYDYRWTLTLTCQYNPIVYIPQQSATTLAIETVEALP